MNRPLLHRGRQRGVALIIGLIILIVLALLGVSAYSVATQDERIAGNARDHARAADAAESMLRTCEAYIQANAPVFDGTTVPGMLPAPTPGQTWVGENPNTNWFANSFPWPAGKVANPDWSQLPQCIAEEFDVVNAPQVGRPGQNVSWKVAHVAARGYGLTTNTYVTLVSYIAYAPN